MRKTIFGCLGATAVAFAMQFTPADVHAAGGLFSQCLPCDAAACDPCDPCGDGCAPVKAGKWFLHGHMEAGFFANSHGATSTYPAAPYNIVGGTNGADFYSGNTGYLQNTRLTGGQINQIYVSMGKAVDGKRGLDIGGTIDFTWGSDAYQAQAKGLESHTGNDNPWGKGDYYAAFAQAYGEIAFNRWNVKAGKFYLPFGSDSYKSTENFFYSWSPTMYIAPTTGGGVLATYQVNNRLSVLGGWVMPGEIGESDQNNAVAAGLIWTPGKRMNLKYVFAVGEDKYTFASTNVKDEYFVQSLTATTQISKRLKYVFDWTYFQTKANENTYAYGINNEIIYQFNKKWSFGTRFGMLRPDGFGDLQSSHDTEWYNVSLGANWNPNKWLTVKPEIRYDWTERGDVADRTFFNGGDNSYQFSGGMSAVVKF